MTNNTISYPVLEELCKSAYLHGIEVERNTSPSVRVNYEAAFAEWWEVAGFSNLVKKFREPQHTSWILVFAVQLATFHGTDVRYVEWTVTAAGSKPTIHEVVDAKYAACAHFKYAPECSFLTSMIEVA